MNRVLGSTYLDLTVPTDSRPFFFNQLRILRYPEPRNVMRRKLNGEVEGGAILGNLIASAVLMMILLISIVAVIRPSWCL